MHEEGFASVSSATRQSCYSPFPSFVRPLYSFSHTNQSDLHPSKDHHPRLRHRCTEVRTVAPRRPTSTLGDVSPSRKPGIRLLLGVSSHEDVTRVRWRGRTGSDGRRDAPRLSGSARRLACAMEMASIESPFCIPSRFKILSIRPVFSLEHGSNIQTAWPSGLRRQL